MSSSDTARLASASATPSYNATDPDLEGIDGPGETMLKQLQRDSKMLYDKGPCQMCRGTVCCPVGGNAYVTVPQYVKDVVDGELGEQTHGQYPPPVLLIPECTAVAETSRCCTYFGQIGQSGPCSEEQDAGQERRRSALGCSIVLVLVAALMFVPVALSVIDAPSIVDRLYWNKVTVHVTGKRVWKSSADKVGTLSKCPVNPARVLPTVDPACGLTFEYKISPGGTLIDGPQNFAAGATGSTARAYNEYRDLTLCNKYFGTRQSACTQCSRSMTLIGIATVMAIGGFVMSVNEILARWDRNYDINFSKATGVLGALFSIPSTTALCTNFEIQCVRQLLGKGTGEMARGSYTPTTLGAGQAAALEWTILHDPAIGNVTILCFLVGCILLVRCLATLFVPTNWRAGDPVTLTDPWDLGVENLDEYTRKIRMANDAQQPKWGKHLQGFVSAVGCLPQCAVCCLEPLLCLKDMCGGLGFIACFLSVSHLILAPCHRICPWFFVDRPDDAPAPRAKRGVVRPLSTSNGNCEELWQQIKKMELPTQQSMKENP